MKHKLRICCGTTCYLAAGNRTDKLEELIRQEFNNKVEVIPTGCLGQCGKVNKEQESQPPYAKFDDEIIYNAKNENIITELKKRLG
ncbi:MAG: hypothetical protein K6E29_07725 [Cyanobacteria bacterium RUI128]|nr:hypothetical protein [Cyanobacteria bacterium RUI128]